jgi:hypothetical protein
MEVSGQVHAPIALPPTREPRYPLDRRLGGPHSRSDEEKDLLCWDACSCRPARKPSQYTDKATPATVRRI